MFKKYFSIMAVLLLLTVAFTGCSASKSDSASTGASMPQDDIAGNTSSYNGLGEEGFEKDSGHTAYDRETSATSESPEQKQEDIRKIIKNGEIAVEVKDVDSSYTSIMQIVKDTGGEEFNKSYYTSGKHKRMELVIKIPPENLDDFEAQLTEFVGSGKIKRKNIMSQDITSEYYDTQSRLESYEASRDQLQELLKKAETVEEILKVQSELTRIQAEIDVFHGRIKMWDKLVSMATITLYIDEEDDPMKHTETVSWEFNSVHEIWRTMKNGFVSVVNTLYNLISWVVIIVISSLPVLIPAGLIVWFILARQKKRKNNNKGNPPLA